MIINSSFEEPVVQSNEILMSFIIPVFNQSNLTKTALKSLSSLSSNYEIIIIDNNSTDDTAEVVMETLWDDEMQTVWASVVAFHFGTRAFGK